MGRSDAELLEASRRGEREAFGALVERYQGVVCAVTYSRTGDRALSEDVAQDTFIAAWRQLDRLREPNRLRSWLCGIARNLARKARRRSAREAPLDHVMVFEGANPFDAASQAESERVVRDALAEVPGTYRDVLVLYYREHRSVHDVAATLGISEAAALQRLARGRQYLADGVTDLVERSLRGRHVTRNLVAGVLAGLPAFAPSRAEATTHGGTMIKLALVGAALVAATTTAYVTRSSGVATPAAPSSSVAAVAAHTERAPAAARPQLALPPGARPTGLPPGVIPEPGPDEAPPVTAEAFAKHHLDRGPSRGPADAPVTIVMFTDMLCQYCGKSIGTLDQLWDEYPSKLRLVIKEMPVHKAAVLPGEAAFAADAQGKFWELHDLMMAHQEDLSRDALLALAGQAGLDVPTFRAALDQHTYADALAADIASAKDLEITATPTFVINGKRVIGIRDIAAFRAVIDEALGR